MRVLGEVTRAASIGTYEDGGLETVFTAMLRAEHWDTKLLQAFRHFLEKHISFDSDVEGGHGAMVRHLAVSAEVCDIWSAFRDLLVEAAPALVE